MIYFIHGLNGFADEWKPFATFFQRKGFPCHSVELKEGMNLRKTRFQDYVDKVVFMVKRKDIIIGHSMGGLIVQKVTEKTPIKTGICICPAPPKGIKLQSLSLVSQLRYVPFIIARIPFSPSFSLAQNHLLNGFSLEEAKNRYKQLQKQSAIVTYEVLKQKISVDEKKVSCPLFFIARKNDFMIAPAIVQRIAQKYQAPLITLPGSHYIFSDAEPIANEIYKFLKTFK